MPYKLEFPTNEMQRLYEVEGLTVREIGERVGMSGQAVHLRLKKKGVEFRPQQVRPRKLDIELLKRLYLVEKVLINMPRTTASGYRSERSLTRRPGSRG